MPEDQLQEKIIKLITPHHRRMARRNATLAVIGLVLVGLATFGGLRAGTTEPDVEQMFIPPGICPEGTVDCRARYATRYQTRQGERGRQHALVLGAIPAVLFIWGAIGFWRWHDPRRSRIGRALNHGVEVVWVFGTSRTQRGRAQLNLGLENGKILELGIAGHDLAEAEQTLRDFLPHATHGFSESNQEKFDSDPVMLRQLIVLSAVLSTVVSTVLSVRRR